VSGLEPGDRAPAISLLDQEGKTVKLSGFKGRKVLVYFYPKADTPGCTTQSCDLRDHRKDLTKLGAAVVGISPDSPERQDKFDKKFKLGFPLLADEDHAVAERFGVWGEKSMYGRKYFGIIRSAFVIDEKGKIADAFYKVSPKATVGKVQGALKALDAA
jgi:peroxiredoxin Q/BCP